MKRYCFSLVLLLTFVVLNGCVKDDDYHYPVIRNTTWKMTNNDNWYRFSFSDSRVHGQMYEKTISDTVFTLTDFYADYVEGHEGGRAYCEWKNEERNIKFRLYSLGADNVVISLYFNFNGEGWLSNCSSLYQFDRDEDPVDGYNF